MTESQWINGGGGLRLHRVAAGPVDAPPILFLHGLLMSHLVWREQFQGPLAETHRLVAIDQRGHGMSEKPSGFEAYRDDRLWAEDLAAAVDSCRRPPVVVVWSYGGLILGNYLHYFGDDAIAGIVHCAAIMGQGQTNPPPEADTPIPFLSEDIGTAIPALNGFSHALTASELSREDFATLSVQAALAPAHARRGCLMRKVDVKPDYARVTKPALVISGGRDALVKRAEEDDAMASMPHAQLSIYAEDGHMPFFESPGRFNDELGRFAAKCFGTT